MSNKENVIISFEIAPDVARQIDINGKTGEVKVSDIATKPNHKTIQEVIIPPGQWDSVTRKYIGPDTVYGTGTGAVDIKEVMTPREAAERWGLKRNTIIVALNSGRFEEQIARGLVRRFEPSHSGKSEWYLTKQAMYEVFGQPRRIRKDDDK